MGVWIETFAGDARKLLLSHTLRGCVDWNTMFSNDGPIKEPSHPAWVCGLKPQKKQRCNSTRCHTLRGCVDWNSLYLLYIHEEVVTPCVGVWIETTGIPVFWNSVWSHPAWVCGLKQANNADYPDIASHTLRGCVDWNFDNANTWDPEPGHTLRGCVDWNLCVTLSFFGHIMSHPAWVCGLKPLAVS